ncbi:hypothetical protein PVAND_005511 [Polypedilum vanderplanki]|uniref:NADH dehydrogenase [ubiquinone] 1 beta subcomplex subunit 6 n=1 Tax=Polypedilum vanderplanki TaxID=319348 RepID=A0A9J6C2A8_POLVA|nr:hypothetical protein PVAND_005511 [Polypedilum vanderplanki]
MVEASETSGVKPFPIGGRMVRERERCIGMTDEERAWRKKYLKDQILSEHEPRYVPEYWKERTNVIRRIYKTPLDMMHKALTPILGHSRAYTVRFFTGKFAMIFAGIYAGWYYLKYNSNDWTRKGGWRVHESRTISLPGDSDFPRLSQRTKPSDYANRGFDNSPI